MKVHFAASLSDFEQHAEAYAEITEAIRHSGGHVVRDWLDEATADNAMNKTYTKPEWQAISDLTLDAVVQADLVIVDASMPTFSLGYQAAVALAHKKPLLVLFQEGNENHELIYDSSYSLMDIQVYASHKDIKSIVTTFIGMHNIDSKDMRFNMFLDRESYTYLNWESAKTGKTKAQIIREIVRKQSHMK
jgi:hypothetical protein